jgi:hypothetical protein
MKDFFISYTGKDSAWAEWIAWILEDAGYSLIIQAWDFVPGSNYMAEMNNAVQTTHRTIAVFSRLSLSKSFTQAEWFAAIAKDPLNRSRKLIPVRVEVCKPEGLLGQIVYCDVFDCDEDSAKKVLLEAVGGRMKPDYRPQLPPRQLPWKPRVPFPPQQWIPNALILCTWMINVLVSTFFANVTDLSKTHLPLPLVLTFLGVIAGTIDGIITERTYYPSFLSIQNRKILILQGGGFGGFLWLMAGLIGDPRYNMVRTTFMIIGAVFCYLTILLNSQRLSGR